MLEYRCLSLSDVWEKVAQPGGKSVAGFFFGRLCGASGPYLRLGGGTWLLSILRAITIACGALGGCLPCCQHLTVSQETPNVSAMAATVQPCFTKAFTKVCTSFIGRILSAIPK